MIFFAKKALNARFLAFYRAKIDTFAVPKRNKRFKNFVNH
jgi:hypothetical protein